MLTRILAIASFVLLITSTVGARTWSVTPGGPLTIQGAVDGAADGDSVLLAGFPSEPFNGPGNRDIELRGKAIVVTGAGFDPVVDCGGGATEPHRGFVFWMSEGPGTILEHLTVTNASTGSLESGGAVLCMAASPTIQGCRFVGSGAVGAGNTLFIRDSSPRISDCLVENVGEIDSFEDGAAVDCLDGAPVIENCTIRSNYCIGLTVGGGPGTTMLRNCIIEENEWGLSVGDATVEACLIRANQALGAYVWRDTVFRDCQIVGNTGWFSLVAMCPRLEMERCVISGNFRGPTAGSPGLDALFRACLITGNGGAGSDGALWLDEGVFRIENCTIAGNSVPGSIGGELRCTGSTQVTISRSIVRGNCASGAGGDIRTVGSPLTLECSCFDPARIVGAWTDLGENVKDDPLFCDPTDCGASPTLLGDYGLQSNSPCAAEHSPCHQLIGALDVACGATAVQPSTWGLVKQRFGPAGLRPRASLRPE